MADPVKPLNTITKLSDKLSLVERRDGFWLWDDTRKMNIAVKEKTSTDAFVYAITSYQRRLADVEEKYQSLKTKVDTFLEQFAEPE